MIQKFVLGFAFLLTALVSGAFGLAISDRSLPVETLAVNVLTPVVEPGSKLRISRTIRYKDDCAAYIDRVLLDDQNHRKFLSEVKYETPPQGLGVFTIIDVEDVPEYFEPGQGTFKTAPIYWCNLIQKYFWPIRGKGTLIKFEIRYLTTEKR